MLTDPSTLTFHGLGPIEAFKAAHCRTNAGPRHTSLKLVDSLSILVKARLGQWPGRNRLYAKTEKEQARERSKRAKEIFGNTAAPPQ
jgi:hypothetical protein